MKDKCPTFVIPWDEQQGAPSDKELKTLKCRSCGRLKRSHPQPPPTFMGCEIQSLTLGRTSSADPRIERRDGRNGTRWAVVSMGYCLSRRGEWEYEPTPSSRTDAFLKRCRFATIEEAIAAARKAAPL